MALPERIGRYRAESVVGVGGFATVVRAWDETLDDTVAIKVLAENWSADPDIRERFLQEARLLRRIRSEHLITVHDIGTLDDGRPYFVMEFADRGTLAARLAKHPSGGLDPTSAGALVDALASGLGALHEAAIVHRDVNPNNLLLRSLGRDKGREQRRAAVTQLRSGLLGAHERLLLGDLGLAKDLMGRRADASVVGGTPFYLAPEQRDAGARVGPASDVFAATGVLWEAITANPPPEPSRLGGALTAVDRRWHEFFEQGFALDPEERHESMDHWRQAALDLLAASTGEAETGTATRRTMVATSPYKGLVAFQPEDASRFFGRDSLVADLLERLQGERKLVVGGPSGSGKSSVVRAGLVPAVAAGELEGSDRWPVALFTPGTDPIGELAYQLGKAGRAVTQLTTDLDDDLGRDARRGRFLAESITDRTGGLLVVVDQFEELFTQGHSRDEQQAFVDALAAIVDPTDSRVRLVLIVRADFYGACAMFPWLAQAISRNQVLVGPMTRLELRQIIEQPAQEAGLTIEDGLVDVILDDGASEPGALPLVSHALVETWRRRKGRVLTLEGYRQSGGVAGAIAQSAEALYGTRFDDTQQETTRRLLLQLVNPGEGTPDTRRRLPAAGLAADAEHEAMSQVVEELTGARLLTADEDSIEIAHEALIQTWPRLRGWIEESRDDLRRRQRIGRASAEWLTQDRDPDLLYRGTPLQSALEWAAEHGEDLSPTDREFLEASEAARRADEEREARAALRSRRLRRRAVTALAVLTGVAVVATTVALIALGRARSNEEQATLRLAQSLATQAAGLTEDDPRLALALAVEAMARSGTAGPEAREALVEGSRLLEAAPFAPARAPVAVGNVLSVAVAPDGAMVATGGRDGSVRLWDTASGQPLGPPVTGHDGGVETMVFHPGGRWLVSGGHDGRVLAWDVADPTAVPEPGVVGTVEAVIWAVVVHPDQQTVASGAGDGRIHLWEFPEGGQIGNPLVDTSSADALAVSPDGSLLVSGNARGEVTGWRLPDGEQVLGPIRTHESGLRNLVFDEEGARLATRSSDGSVRVWQTATGDLLAEPFSAAGGDLRGVQFVPGGLLLLAGDEQGRLRIWDLDRGQEVATVGANHDGQVLATSLTPDGRLLATISTDDQTMRLWTSGGPALGVSLTGHDEGAFGVAVSPDGDLVATGDGAGAVRLYDADQGLVRVGPLVGHTAPVWSLAFSPDGQTLASGDEEGDLYLWDADTGEQRAGPVGGHDGWVAAITFDGSGDRVLTGGADGWVVVRDRLGEPTGSRLGPHPGGVTGMALEPGGTTLAVSDGGGTVRLWDIDRLSLATEPHQVLQNALWGLAWSPDGTLLATASADEVVSTWRVPDFEPVAHLAPHPGGATAVGFLGDGLSVVTASRDGSVRIWDNDLGRALGGPLPFHGAASWRLAVHPDGSRFITTSEDGSVRIWDVFDLERACDRADGAFDEEQRRRFLGSDEEAAGCS